MKQLVCIYLLVCLNIIGSELSLDYFNIYNSEKYKLIKENIGFDTKYLDFDYNQSEYKIEEYALKPDLWSIKLKTPFYDINYQSLELNFEPLIFSDERIDISNNKIEFLEHKLKFPINDFKLEYKIGAVNDYQFDLMHEYIDLNSKDFELNNQGISFSKCNTNLSFSRKDIKSEFLINETSPVGQMKGNIDEVSFKRENSEIIYRKINGNIDIDVDNKTAYFVTTMGNRYIYIDLDLEMDNFEYRYEFIKNWSKSKFTFDNTFGVLVDNNSSFILNQEYYEDKYNFGIFKVKSKVSEEKNELVLGDRYIYYNWCNLKYEKRMGNLTFYLEKGIPFIYNRSLTPKLNKETVVDSEPINTSNEVSQKKEKKEKILDLLLSATKIKIKYEF